MRRVCLVEGLNPPELDTEAGREFAGLLLDHLAQPEAPLHHGRRAVDALGEAVRRRSA